MNTLSGLAELNFRSFFEYLDHAIGRSALSNTALISGCVGLIFLLAHLRRKRREEGIRAEVRAYLGTNGAFSVTERSIVDKLVTRMEALEKRLDGLEHDIRVIVEHLQRRNPPSPGADGPKSLTKAA